MYRLVFRSITGIVDVVTEDGSVVKSYSADDWGSYANAVAQAREYWYRHLHCR